MVTLTLTQTINFFKSLPKDVVFVSTANPNNQTAGTLLHVRPSTHANAYYAHAISGAEKAYTIGSGLKKAVYSGSSINILTDTVTGLSRNFRFNCGNNFPLSLPQHQAHCQKITNVFFNLGTSMAYVIPENISNSEFFDYLEQVTSNPAKIRAFPFNANTPRRYPIYLNDFSQNKTPVYYPKRRR